MGAYALKDLSKLTVFPLLLLLWSRELYLELAAFFRHYLHVVEVRSMGNILFSKIIDNLKLNTLS